MQVAGEVAEGGEKAKVEVWVECRGFDLVEDAGIATDRWAAVEERDGEVIGIVLQHRGQLSDLGDEFSRRG